MKKKILCGGVQIGGGAAVSIQSMTNTNTSDIASTTAQIKGLESAGCQIVRLAVPDAAAAAAFGEIRKRINNVPLVADIHFDYRLALAAMEAGADKIRINPGNIGSEEGVRRIAETALKKNIPIRVGVNSGSLEKDILARYGRVTADGLAESALRNVATLEKYGFDDIVISLKSSDVKMNFEAYKRVDAMSDYPLHIGVTESGTTARGSVKSAVGIGALLLEGIGDTMRVSLTADPVEEVYLAKEILAAAGLDKGGIELVSCPTCGRTEVDLTTIAEEVDRRLEALRKKGAGPMKVAVMGCAVNGPGEAKGADIGVACGRGKGVLFADGEIVGTVGEEEIVDEIIKMAEAYGKHTEKVR